MPEFSTPLAKAIGAVIEDRSVDPAFAAQMVTLPSVNDIARDIGSDVDHDAIFLARKALRSDIGKCRESTKALKPARWQHRTLTNRGDRRHARRSDSRSQGCDQRDQDADDERNDDRPRLEHRARLRQVDPERDKQRVEALREREPEEQADDRCDDADHERLEHHRGADLPPRCPQRAQGRQFPGALGDRDRQRVGDHEAAHEQGDAAEGEQEVLEDVEEPGRVLGGLLRLGLAGSHLGARREQRLDRRHQLVGRDALRGGDVDLVELPDLVEERLGGREREHREGRATERGQAGVLDRADDLELTHGTARDDADVVSHRVVLLTRGGSIDVDLVRTARPVTGGQRHRVEALTGRVIAEGKAGSAAARDDLAVVSDELCLIGNAPVGRTDLGERADTSQQRLRERGHRRAVAGGAVRDRALAGDDRVGVLEGLREDGRERSLDGVGQYVRPTDHRHAEHDRDGCE